MLKQKEAAVNKEEKSENKESPKNEIPSNTPDHIPWNLPNEQLDYDEVAGQQLAIQLPVNQQPPYQEPTNQQLVNHEKLLEDGSRIFITASILLHSKKLRWN